MSASADSPRGRTSARPPSRPPDRPRRRASRGSGFRRAIAGRSAIVPHPGRRAPRSRAPGRSRATASGWQGWHRRSAGRSRPLPTSIRRSARRPARRRTARRSAAAGPSRHLSSGTVSPACDRSSRAQSALHRMSRGPPDGQTRTTDHALRASPTPESASAGARDPRSAERKSPAASPRRPSSARR